MTQEEIIEMARQAGARQMVSCLTHPNGPVTALKFDLDSESIEALAQPDQEPAAKVMFVDGLKTNNLLDCDLPVGTLLYTTPPQRKPLTEEQMDAMIDGCPKYHGRFSTKDPDGKLNYYELIRAIEAAHGIKE